MIAGRHLILALNGKAVAAAKSCQISTDVDFISVCSPVSGRAKEYKPSAYGWSLSCDCLCTDMSNADRIIRMQLTNTLLDVRFYDPTLGINRYGKAYIKTCTAAGTVGSLAKFSITLQPTGELMVSYGTDITLSHDVVIKDTEIICDGNKATAIVADEDCSTYIHNLTITDVSRVWLFSVGANSCIFLHNENVGASMEQIIDDKRIDEFNSASKYIGHAHGKDGMFSAVLAPGNYTITFSESGETGVRASITKI